MTGREEKIAKARELSARGLNTRQIGERLGVHAGTVWRWLNPERTHELVRADNAKRGPAKRAWLRSEAGRGRCERCGGLKGTSGRRYRLCSDCRQTETRAFEAAVVDGYRAGLTAHEIAQRIGRSPASVRNVAVRLRRRGINVPYAPTGARAHRAIRPGTASRASRAREVE